MRRLSAVGIAAAATVAALVVLRPRITRVVVRAIIRRRIRRLHGTLDALQAHAAAARALDHAYSHQQLPAKADRQAQEDAEDAMRTRVRAVRLLQRRTLKTLQEARAVVDANLLQLQATDLSAAVLMSIDDGAAVRRTECSARVDLASEAKRALDLLGALPAAPGAPPSRQKLLSDEQRALATANAQQPHALRRTVRALRGLESSIEFQAELVAAQRAVAASTGYTSANFAYGSTPLQSWLALFASAPLREALAAAPSGGLRYVVLGSSLGSLVMYGACVHGLRSHGIEILPLLAARAAEVATAAGVKGASFECADMLCVDLSQSDVVLLASQCWDESLIAALRTKLLEELVEGALVLDYTPALGEASGLPGRMPGARKFTLACKVRAPVSWDEAHCFWVWRVSST